MLEKYLLRPPTIDHAPAVLDLLVRCDKRDVGFADSELEDLLHDWNSINLERDAWLAIDAAGSLRGYAACLPWAEGVRLVIHDDPGSEGTDLFAGLLLFSEQRARGLIGEMNDPHKQGIYTHVSDPVTHQKKAVEAAGYAVKKFIFNMHRDLSEHQPDPQLPRGITFRTAITGQDDRAIHALVQEAFDWRERTPQPFETWKQALMRPEIYNENLWFLAVQDGEIIATCLCFKYSGMGWIRQLAVKKPLRKLGIGRALLQRSFQVFQEMGMPKAGLAVESDNANAVHFYETAGMYKAVHLNEYAKVI
jgi:mycothiol synthase